MKVLTLCLISLLFYSSKTYSQNEIANTIKECNNLLEKDIRTKYTSYNQEAAKRWFYEYFKSDAKNKSAMKRNRSNDFGFKAVVDAIPIEGNANLSDGSAKDLFSKIQTTAIKEGYVSNENLELLITSFVPTEAFTSYNECIKLTKYLVDQSGIKISIASQTEDVIVLKLVFKSTPGGGKVTIADADYTGGAALYGQKFVAGKQIKDGQTLFEQIQREEGKDVIVTINFREKIPGVTANIPSESKRSKEAAIPIGAIVPSLLPYKNFMEVNGYKETSELKNLTWVPCDGRIIASSRYATNGGGNVAPDLRGVFLRGINDYQVPGGGEIKKDRLNPESTVAGEFQQDAIQIHTHNFRLASGYDKRGLKNVISSAINKDAGGNPDVPEPYDPNDGFSKMSLDASPKSSSSIETRPKNITVYYYLKIN